MSIHQMSVGDVIRSGHYPQSHQGQVMPIEWRVLECASGIDEHILSFYSFQIKNVVPQRYNWQGQAILFSIISTAFLPTQLP